MDKLDHDPPSWGSQAKAAGNDQSVTPMMTAKRHETWVKKRSSDKDGHCKQVGFRLRPEAGKGVKQAKTSTELLSYRKIALGIPEAGKPGQWSAWLLRVSDQRDITSANSFYPLNLTEK